MTYWPVAICSNVTMPNNTIHTYDGASSLEVAQKVFFLWANEYGYKLVHAWIDVYDRGQKVEQIEYYKDEEALRRMEEEQEAIASPSEPVSESVFTESES